MEKGLPLPPTDAIYFYVDSLENGAEVDIEDLEDEDIKRDLESPTNITNYL